MKKTLLALILFTALTLLMTYPLVLRLETGLRGLGDPLLNTWIMSRNIDRIAGLSFRDFFEAGIFYPHRRTLAYSEHLLPQSLAGLPVQLLSGNPVLTYNVVFLLAIVTTGLGMYFLVRYLTESSAASVIAGIIFAFSPFMTAHYFQLQVLTAGGIPLAFLFLHRFFKSDRTSDLVLFSLFFLLQILANGYYALFLSFFAGLFILVKMVASKKYKKLRFWMRPALAGILIAVLSGPFFYQYGKVKKEMGLHREIGMYAGLKSFLSAPKINRVYGRISEPFWKPEGELFPGIVPFLLAVTALVLGIKKSGRSGGNSPEELKPQPFSVRTGTIGIYSLILVLAFLFTLGPNGPYVLLHKYVPGFSGLRAVSRFQVFVMFALAVLAGFGVKSLLGRLKGGIRPLATVLIMLLILTEYASFPIPLEGFPGREKDVPEIYRLLPPAKDGDSALLELPIPAPGMGIARVECPRVFYTLYHHRPLVNGYSGFIPPLYRELERRWKHSSARENIRDLKELGVRLIILHSSLYDPERFDRLREEFNRMEGDLRFLLQAGEAFLYEIVGSGETLGDETALRAFSRDGWKVKAGVHSERAGLAIDGNQATRWDCGFQKGGEYFEVDFGRVLAVSGISMSLGDKPHDYAKGFKVEISLDGKDWVEVSKREKTAVPLKSFLTPQDLRLEISFPRSEAGFLRITNTGKDESYYWSIFELEVI